MVLAWHETEDPEEDEAYFQRFATPEPTESPEPPRLSGPTPYEEGEDDSELLVAAFLPDDRVYLEWDDPEQQKACIQKLLTAVPDADPEYVQDLVQRSTPEHFETFYSLQFKGAGVRLIFQTILRNGGYFDAHEVRSLDPDRRRMADLEDLGLVFLRSGNPRNNNMRYTLSPESFISNREARCSWTRLEEKQVREFYGFRCNLCPPYSTERGILDCDHRVPHRIAGNRLIQSEGLCSAIQLLCRHHNGLKQSACVKCPNSQPDKLDIDTCRTCQWSGNKDFTHSGCNPEYRLTLLATTEGEVKLLKSFSPQEALKVLHEHQSKEVECQIDIRGVGSVVEMWNPPPG